MLEVQKTLLAGTPLDQLKSQFGINIRRHPKYNNLVLLKYDQIESPMGIRLVQECRGLILDEAEGWRVICRPFDKFFNYGEGHAAPIDWSTAQVQEKLDGSLATMYWYDGKWNVSTSGSPDAGGEVGGFPFTFGQLFWNTFNEMGLKLPTARFVDYNFMFELMSPYNRIVVRHEKAHIKLIGVRNRFSGQEYSVTDPHIAATGYPAVRSFPLTSFDAIMASFPEISGVIQEGYVTVDGNFNRNKVKNPQYVAIHHMRGEDGPTPKRMLQVARTGEGSEVLTHFPEWKPLYDDVKGKFDELLAELEAGYIDATDKTAAIQPPLSKSQTQKEFASHAVKTRLADALFRMRAGKENSIKQYLAEMDLTKLASILKLKEVLNGNLA